jgi:hypothetical protein
MQTFEAILSFLFLITISSFMLGSFQILPIDDSLYRIQLAGDAWRVLYLRGDFHDFSDIPASKHSAIEKDLDELGDQTGLCFFLEGLRITNCRGGDKHETVAVLHKTVLMDGVPGNATFSLSK